MENMVLSDIKNNVVEEEYMKFNNPNEVKEFKVVLENLQMERQRNDAIDSVSKNEEVEKMREKVKGKDIITLPETISEEKPLEVFGCNKEQEKKFKQVLGDAKLYAWSLYDKADNTLTICLKYVVNGNEDVPIRKIQRQRILNSNGYLGFLYDYAGMDKRIVQFAEDVLKKAMKLFDKAEKGRYVKMSIIDVYKEVIAVVENGEQESETTKKRRKTVEINETNGNVVKYVCVRGTKEMASILKEIGSPYSRAHFLESIKNIKNIKNKKNGLEEKREFLKVSEGRHYDYTETGGTHWTYLRVYEDLLEEGTVCTQN